MKEKEEEDKKVDTEEIKKETVETVNQVKDTIKNVDIKKDAKEAKGFVSEMFRDPFAKIKEIVDDKKNKNFKLAIIFIAVWTIAVLLKSLSTEHWAFNILFRNIFSLVKVVIAPALGILVLSAIVYMLNKKEKRSLTTVITAITIANIPLVVSSIINLLTIFSYSAYKITTPISGLCSVITIILTYFTIKTLFKEEQNSKFLKTFVIIEAIYYVAYILISFLEIYI